MNFLKTPLTIFEKLEFTDWEISDTNFDFSPSGKSQPWEAQASVCAKQAWASGPVVLLSVVEYSFQGEFADPQPE